MVAAGVVVPHPEKVKTGGEDAFMIANSRDKGKSRRYSLAVADGVSSWSKAGVDAGAYSSVLVTTAREVLMSGDTEYVTEGSLSQKVIGKAQDSAKVPGSSTFVVASLDESTGILDVANVGDTGVRVVRKGEVVLTSTPKQHQFECPYQLASPAFAEVNDQFDSAADAECLSFPLQDGDWLIFGSDGLYDNMYDEELVQILGGVSTTDPFSAAQAISRELAALSQDHSLDKKRETPYADALAAEKESKEQFKRPAWMRGKRVGGKLDDITVVAAAVVARTEAGEGELEAALDAADAAAAKCSAQTKVVADVAIKANAENAEKQQRLRDKIAARERQFQQSLER